MSIVNRFLKYIQMDTTSNPKSGLHPSSPSQKQLGAMLVDEMHQLGIEDAYMDEYGYVYGTILGNIEKTVPIVGFVAHMDTSSDMPAHPMVPNIFQNYDGNDVLLNAEENIILSVSQFPFLRDLKGETLIVTNGKTLLGADNKAGIAEILTMAEILQNNPSIQHGTIKLAFTPDEEIGEGTLFFNVKGFSCDFAYTVDGGNESIVNYENFNAASATVQLNGVNIHPGTAKGKMINSILIAQEFHQMLPVFLNPAFTDGYEGFNHLNEIQGNVEKTVAHYIIRNHDKKLFEKQKAEFIAIESFINQKYGSHTCQVQLKDSYYNMYECIKDRMDVVDLAKRAIRKCNLNPMVTPIRGGTDGATLTYKGILCPNLGTGGYNFHGRYECITVEAMERVTQILLSIINEMII